MRRLVYGSPASDEPSGGVKVFHRHVEVLRAMGHEAAIWHPGSVGFRCSWFEHEAPVVETPDLHPANDFIVLPEIIASLFFGKVMSNNLNNDRLLAVLIGGCLLILAGLVCAIIIKEEKQEA